MSVNPDALTGEVLNAAEYQEGAKAFLFLCGDCGRQVFSETLFLDGHGTLHCMSCMETNDLAEDI